MSHACVEWVLENSQAAGVDRLVMVVLATHADPRGRRAFPAVSTIASKALAHPKTVEKSLLRLQAAGVIRCIGRTRTGTRVWDIVMTTEAAAAAVLKHAPATPAVAVGQLDLLSLDDFDTDGDVGGAIGSVQGANGSPVGSERLPEPSFNRQGRTPPPSPLPDGEGELPVLDLSGSERSPRRRRRGRGGRSSSLVAAVPCPLADPRVAAWANARWTPIAEQLHQTVDERAWLYLQTVHVHSEHPAGQLVVGSEHADWIRDRYGRLLIATAGLDVRVVLCAGVREAIAG